MINCRAGANELLYLVLQESAVQEFEEKKRQWEEEAEAKTAKNRAKRQKKKERAKGKGAVAGDGKPAGTASVNADTGPLKKRRLVNGAEIVFRKPGEEGSEDEDEDAEPGPTAPDGDDAAQIQSSTDVAAASDAIPVVVDTTSITIIEED